MTGFEDDRRGADISECGEYRYRLWREWDTSKPTLAFVMLNPSTADDVDDDPTIRRCIGYAEDWGYGRLDVANLFALRSPDPETLFEHAAPIGPENDAYLEQVADDADRIVAAWGAKGSYRGRHLDVLDLLQDYDDVVALDTTKHGLPNHSLYQPKDIEPVAYPPAGLDLS